MVGIQFIMTMSFSFLSPIMPLFLPKLVAPGIPGPRRRVGGLCSAIGRECSAA